MRTVWVLKNATKQPVTYYVAHHSLPSDNKDRAKWFQSEHHANTALTFELKHNGFVATQVNVSVGRNHPYRR